MLTNRQATTIAEGALVSLLLAAFPAVLAGSLASYAYDTRTPALYIGLSVWAVCITVVGTVIAYGVTQERRSWNEAHQPENINISLAPRNIPELDANDNPLYHQVVETNAGEHRAGLILSRTPSRRLVNPEIPRFVTITEMRRLATDTLNDMELTHKNFCGAGRPFSRSQWDELIKYLKAVEIVENRNNNIFGGVRVTDGGRVWMQSILDTYPPSQKSYRAKM